VTVLIRELAGNFLVIIILAAIMIWRI